MTDLKPSSSNGEFATLAGGCFWCLEAVYAELRGVEKVESGYMGGRLPDPSYEAVCTGTTDHAEVVQISFDPLVISYPALLQVFFAIHDPTTLNCQGHDVGTQYRSAIFYHSLEQKGVAEDTIEKLTKEAVFTHPIVTAVVPAGPFFLAESYHQAYFARNPSQPYCAYLIGPKISKFRKQFAGQLKTSNMSGMEQNFPE